MERECRRSSTLSEQLAVVEPFVLRDFLKLRDDDEVRPSSVVAPCDQREAFTAVAGGSSRPGRTLLDVIRDETETGGIVMGANSGNAIKWKTLKDHLRRASAAWASSSSSGARTNPIADREFFASSVCPNSILPQHMARSISAPTAGNNPSAPNSTAAAPCTSPPEGGEETASSREMPSLGPAAEPRTPSMNAAMRVEQPVGPSLMALLQQTDRYWGGGDEPSPLPVLAVAMLSPEGDVADDEATDGVAKLHVCCVCMVRRKGAAFIPCGHTFCRLCSRELWVSRGSCPICNGFILEILDIF